MIMMKPNMGWVLRVRGLLWRRTVFSARKIEVAPSDESEGEGARLMKEIQNKLYLAPS